MPSKSHTDKPSTTPTVPPATGGRCKHLRADGKRCADAVYPGHTTLCRHHLSQQMRGITDAERIAADILAPIGNFQSATGIHLALSKLLLHQLTGRISRRDASTLLYNMQLLLQALPAVKAEIREEGFQKFWREETRRLLVSDSDLDRLTDPALLPSSAKPLHPADVVPPPPPQPATQTAPPVAPPLQSSSGHVVGHLPVAQTSVCASSQTTPPIHPPASAQTGQLPVAQTSVCAPT